MNLNILWFILITILYTGFFFLEGFDFGVGILLPFLGKNDTERRSIINTIGPHWDGNEVWLLTAGGATFAAFPDWYATMFSGFYPALFLLLLALIVRGVSFEFRSKDANPRWRSLWDWAAFTGSLLAALLLGVTVGNWMRGVAIDGNMMYSGGLLPLLNPFALLGGLVFIGLFTMHGANFLSLKTTGKVMERASKVAFRAWLVTTVLTVAFLIWAFFTTDILTKAGVNGLIPAVLAAVALLASGWLVRAGKSGWAFVTGSLTVVLATLMVFTGLFPRLLISTLGPDWSLTITNASSSPYTLRLMTIVALVFVPLVLLYQGWTYWIFRKRVGTTSKELTY